MNIFGFTIKRKKINSDIGSVVTPTSDDGTTVVTSANAAAYYGTVLDIEGTIKNENDLIRRYREAAQYADCDSAIEDIVNEAIVSNDLEQSVKINLDQLKVSETIKKKMTDEFANVLRLFNFKTKGHDIFRQWYVDGRLYYHILVDEKNTKNGIAEMRYVNPIKIRKVKNVEKGKSEQGVEMVKKIEEYYLYNDKGIVGQAMTQGVKLSLDSIVFCPSGLQDGNTGMMLSALHKAIKPVNQLKMIEDAVVIYRISRAPERRVFYVDVGNLPKLKAEQYVNDIMNKFRNKIVYDAVTGETTDNKKHLCLVMDTKVPLLDGRTLSITEIAEEVSGGKKLWVYSCDPMTGKFAPGLISWAGITRKDAPLMRITLDNGETITCTPEHKFPIWNKGFVSAESLIVGESLIPHYRKNICIDSRSSSKGKDYEQIWDNTDSLWKFTHREVSLWKDANELENEFLFNEKYKDETAKTVHHKNINRFDNSPENLVRMNSKDHIVYHQHSSSGSGKIGGKRCYELSHGFHNKNHKDYKQWHVNGGLIGGTVSSSSGKSSENLAKGRKVLVELIQQEEWNANFREKQKLGWSEGKKEIASVHAKKNKLSERGNTYQSEQYKNKHSKLSLTRTKQSKTEYPKTAFDFIANCAKFNNTVDEIVEFINTEFNIIEEFKTLNKFKVMSGQKDYTKINYYDITRIINQNGYKSYTHLKEAVEFRNHKISKIEFLVETADTGCLTIDGDELYHNYHTFALDAGVYTQNSMMEDFWMPRREGGKGTEITTLPGGQNLGDIQDIEYFQKKLYQALNVPFSRMQQAQGFSIGRTSEINRDEIKFNKFIVRMRNKFSLLFSETLRVQLIFKGIIRPDEWDDIEHLIAFDYQQDNHFTEIKDTELLQNRIAILQQLDPYIGRFYSNKWIRKNLLKQTDEDILEEDAQMATEQPSPEEKAFTNPVPIQQGNQQ